MSQKIAVVLVVLGGLGMLKTIETGVTIAMQPYQLQESARAAQSNALLFASLGALLVGAVLWALDARKKR